MSQDGTPTSTSPTPTTPASNQTQAAVRESAPLGGGPAPVADAPVWAGAAMLLGAALVAWAVRWKMGKKRAEGGHKPRPSEHGRGTGGTGEVDRELVADMKELTERLAEELDRKAARLEKLIAAADERVRRLEAGLVRETRVVEVKPEARRRDVGIESAHREVYELADAGLTALEIATRLGQPTGQVELILNLRKGTVAL
jgi:hypothetical protein